MLGGRVHVCPGHKILIGGIFRVSVYLVKRLLVLNGRGILLP
jgi:hypothetical protein